MKHVIVEGCDASGKDTLIRQLITLMPEYTLHARASTSLGGPVDDLAAWVSMDVNTITDQPPSIYNRHPLISEPVYRRYRTAGRPTPREFDNSVWYTTMVNWLAKNAVLVLCMPGWSTVKAVVTAQGPTAHMPGVFENIHRIYMDYMNVPNSWPEPIVHYDYANPNHTPERVVDQIRKAA